MKIPFSQLKISFFTNEISFSQMKKLIFLQLKYTEALKGHRQRNN